jgi:hypothetical protein
MTLVLVTVIHNFLWWIREEYRSLAWVTPILQGGIRTLETQSLHQGTLTLEEAILNLHKAIQSHNRVLFALYNETLSRLT